MMITSYGGLTMGHVGHGPQASRLEGASRFANHKKKEGEKEEEKKKSRKKILVRKKSQYTIGIVKNRFLIIVIEICSKYLLEELF